MIGFDVSQPVAAPVPVVWDAVVDWERQSDWMVGTTTRTTAQDGQGVGGGVEGRTGVGPLAFTDVMVVDEWEPPHRVGVRKVGRLLKGRGAFSVRAAPDGGSVVTWSGEPRLPLGPLGSLAFLLQKPLFLLLARRSLRTFAASVEAGTAARAG